jgi:DNA-binding CsgD family transcriptional regulator
MVTDPKSYSLFFKFIEKYAPLGFQGINPNDPLVLELEELMEEKNQFIMAGDYLQLKILYTSNRSSQMFGIEPADLNPYHFIEGTHPDDVLRHSQARAKNINLAKDIFNAKGGQFLLSTNLRMRNTEGIYNDLLYQCFLFYSEKPIRTVYTLQIHTNIDWFKFKKKLFHYYIGNNMSMFRYPDEALLQSGIALSDREYEIVQHIQSGLSSEQIAEKIFLSVHTVNTHRSNILSKSGFSTIAELIYDYQKQGLL